MWLDKDGLKFLHRFFWKALLVSFVVFTVFCKLFPDWTAVIANSRFFPKF
jgi:hypothetical protein